MKYSISMLKGLLTLFMLVFLQQAQSQTVTVPFTDGVLGIIGSNSQDIGSVKSFSTLGIQAAYFSQQTLDGTFYKNQGNDITGQITLAFTNGKFVTFDGALVWEKKVGGTPTVYGYNAAVGVSFNISEYTSATYSITGGNDGGMTNFAFKRNDRAFTFPADDDAFKGDAATSGLLDDLNAYLTVVNANRPSGPITVVSQTTTDTTPIITGTASFSLTDGEYLEISVGGIVYTYSNTNSDTSAITLSGTNSWSLQVSNTLAIAVYPVNASIKNSNMYLLTDPTNNELTIIGPPTVTTTPVTTYTNMSGVMGGNVTNSGNTTVTTRGIYYLNGTSELTSSTIVAGNVSFTSGSGTGSYSELKTGLTAGTTYYAVAFATNAVGTVYGGVVSFTTATSASPGITVYPSPLTVSEDGTTQHFHVLLDSDPEGTVYLDLTRSDSTEASLSTNTLTFDSSNWSATQTVTVTGVDDTIIDGTITSTVVVSVNTSTSTPSYTSVTSKTVTVYTTDNDAVGYTVSPTSVIVWEQGPGNQTTFTVVLTSAPSSNVVFKITGSDNTEATLDKSSLTFTTSNWSTPQVVTVTGVQDLILDGNVNSLVTVEVVDAESDDNYDSLSNKTVNVLTKEPDTDGDGVSDADEERDGSDKNDPCSYLGNSVTLPQLSNWETLDCDNDGLSNKDEKEKYGTNPQDPDTDGDGVLDGTEVVDKTDPRNPCDYLEAHITVVQRAEWGMADCDNDGLPNSKEKELGTDPIDPDTDGDGVKDGDEVKDKTNPLDPCDYVAAHITVAPKQAWLDADCDNDGLPNSKEKELGTDPKNPDTDGDGVTDGDEVKDGTNPLDPCDFVYAHQTVEPSAAWGNLDCDHDGLPNKKEKELGTDPKNPDTDGDGVTDGDENLDGTNPLDPCSLIVSRQTVTPTAEWYALDCDNDGLPNKEELEKGTDPNNPDTDGDGVKDGDEIKDGTNPLDPCDLVLAHQTVTPSLDWQLLDCDNDGTPNQKELEIGTDPFDKDTDKDAVIDTTEVNDNTNPLDPCDLVVEHQTELASLAIWNHADCDGDGLENGGELKEDTDKDGLYNFNDPDDDNDGIPSIDEFPDPNDDESDRDGLDSNYNGIPDYLEANKGDVSKEIEVYNAVTPNGDGAHELFTVRNIEMFPNNHLEIYNRWGALVYEVDGYGVNGTYFRGYTSKDVKQLPAGVYFYILKYVNKENKTKTLQGYLYLNR